MGNNVGTLLVELGVNTAAFVSGMDKATYKSKQAAKEIGQAFKGLGDNISGLFSQFGSMGSVIGEGISSVGSVIAKVSGQMGSLGGIAGAAAIGITAIGAAGVAAAVGLSALAKEGAEIVHHLSLVSQKTGISIRDLQGLEAAGSTVGVSLDAMVIGFRKFDQAIIGTGRNSTAAGIVLKNLGVTALDNKEALNQVADAFAKMEDGPRKAADAVALFGRTGLNMIPLLDKGRAGLAEFNGIIDEYGAKIGGEAKQANEDYLIAQLKLNTAWDSMKIGLVNDVLPALSKMIGLMADGTKAAKAMGDELFHHVGEGAKGFLSGYFGAKGGTVNDRMTAGFAAIYAARDKREDADPEAKAAHDNEAIKARAIALAGAQQKVEEKIAMAIRDGGKFATILRLEKEKIAELEAVGHWSLASKEYGKLPKMERDASQEKQRLQYRLDPKATALGADKIVEMNAALDEEVTKQTAIAGAVGLTTRENVVAIAIAEEQLKISATGRSLINEQMKAEEELARLKSQWGTQAYHDAEERLKQIKTERKELDASAASMISKRSGISGSDFDRKLAIKLKDEEIALRNDADAWEINAAAIGGNTQAKIDAAVASARLLARKSGATEPEIDMAGRKAGQSATNSANSALLEERATMDLNQVLAIKLDRLQRIQAMEDTNATEFLNASAQEKQAISQMNQEWDKSAMAVGDFSQRVSAGLNELVISGQDFWQKFEESGITAVQSMEGELAKLVTTGKSNFKQVMQSFAEGFAKNAISSVVSKGSSAILGATGLGDLIGSTAKKDGSSQSAALWVQMAAGVGTMGGPLAAAAAAAAPAASGGGLFSGGFGGMLSSLLSFLPGLAGGGDVTPGKAYVVGENHPEFFVPSTPGTIHPSLKMSGSTQNVTNVNFHGVSDADSFRKSQSQIGQHVTNAVSRANSRR